MLEMVLCVFGGCLIGAAIGLGVHALEKVAKRGPCCSKGCGEER